MDNLVKMHLMGDIRMTHRFLARAEELVAAGNEYSIPRRDELKRELESLLTRASEADIPAEEIAASTEYRPVSKLKEEIRLLQGRCEAITQTAESLSAQVIDLRAEVTRTNSACAEIDSDWEASYRRLERVAFAAAVGTFIIGIALGMLV